MHRVGAGAPGDVEHLADVEVGLGRGVAAERVRLVGHPHVQRVAVRVGVDRDAAAARRRGTPGRPGRRSRRGWRSGPCARTHSTGRPMGRHDMLAAVSQPFANYQNEIYLHGLSGTFPELPCEPGRARGRRARALRPRAVRLRRRQRRRPSRPRGPTGRRSTAGGSCRASCATCSARDLSGDVLGTPLPAPVALGAGRRAGRSCTRRRSSPWPARRAALGLPMVLSTVSTYTLEEVAETTGDGPSGSSSTGRRTARSPRQLIAPGEGGRLPALVVTLDTFILAWRPRDLVRAYLPFLHRMGLANYDPTRRSSPGLARARTRTRTPRCCTGGDVRRPRQDLGRPGVAAGALGRPDRAQGRAAPGRRPASRRRRDGRRRRPTTAAGRSTARSRRSTRCRASSRRSATG